MTIRADAEVDRVVIENKRATGVRVVDREVVSAHESSLPRARSAARYPVAFGYPTSHLSDLGIVTIVNLPVGNRLQDQPVFYSIYTLKRELKAMKPALGGPSLDALAGAEPGHLDLLIPGTHVIDPATSPTGGAVVLLRGYTPVVDRAVEPLEPDGSLAPHQITTSSMMWTLSTLLRPGYRRP